mgnify:CR=1 FL=1
MDPQLAGRLDADWEQFVDHGGRLWWWCEMDRTTGCHVCFYESDPEWEKFVDHLGRPWWWRQRGGLCFYEPAGGAAGTPAGSVALEEQWAQREALEASIPNGCCVRAAAASPGAPVWLRHGPWGVCARPGCGYGHKRGPRRHGFCCSACRRGEPYHTVSCSGQGRMVCLAGAAAAAATAEALPRGTRRLDLRHRAKLSQMVRLPVAWKRNTEEEPLAYVLWFMHRYGLQLELGALACWERLSCKLSTVFRRRQLLLYAFRQDSVPDGFQDPSMSVNVHAMGLDARTHSLYSLPDVTGLDFEVQAVLLTKACTALSLLTACEAIEALDRYEFAFVCHGATHRSLACCVLLAAIIYSDATVVLTTARTKAAAIARGLV